MKIATHEGSRLSGRVIDENERAVVVCMERNGDKFFAIWEKANTMMHFEPHQPDVGPKEFLLTDAMMQAGIEAFWRGDLEAEGSRAVLTRAFEAMLAAAGVTLKTEANIRIEERADNVDTRRDEVTVAPDCRQAGTLTFEANPDGPPRVTITDWHFDNTEGRPLLVDHIREPLRLLPVVYVGGGRVDE